MIEREVRSDAVDVPSFASEQLGMHPVRPEQVFEDLQLYLSGVTENTQVRAVEISFGERTSSAPKLPA